MKTSDPQVVVTMADRKSGNLISIAGDVRNPFLVPVSLVGTKLIAAIAAADGSLSDAVAASGGPSDMQANPATIFVCRQEPLAVLKALGKTNLAGNGVTAPVIYQLDLEARHRRH